MLLMLKMSMKFDINNKGVNIKLDKQNEVGSPIFFADLPYKINFTSIDGGYQRFQQIEYNILTFYQIYQDFFAIQCYYNLYDYITYVKRFVICMCIYLCMYICVFIMDFRFNYKYIQQPYFSIIVIKCYYYSKLFTINIKSLCI